MGEKSAAEVVILLFASGVATAVLVLPRAMSAVGYGVMFLLLASGGLISATTTWMLFMAAAQAMADAAKPETTLTKALLVAEGGNGHGVTPIAGPSYGELLALATAPSMSILLDACLVIYTGGGIVTFYLFIASFVQDLPFWPEALTHNITIILMAIVTFPATLLPSIGALSKLSNIVVVVLFCLSFSIWYRAPAAAAQRTEPLLAVADLDCAGPAFCIALAAFVWHNTCVAVAREIRDPTPARCAAIAFSATTLLALTYAFIAFGGYWSFGEELQTLPSILDAYPKDDPLFVALRIAMTCSLLVTADLIIFPLRESCIGLVRKIKPGYRTSPLGHGMWSFGIISVTSVLAIRFPVVTEVISVLGGTVCPFMGMIFPALISRLVLSRGPWILAMVALFSITGFLNLNAFGLVGKPI